MFQDGLIMYEDSFEKINAILDELMRFFSWTKAGSLLP